MPKWEYLFIGCDSRGDFFYPRWVNGQERQDWKQKPPLHVYSQQLGDDGWELAGAGTPHWAFVGGGDHIHLIFKRPKPGPEDAA